MQAGTDLAQRTFGHRAVVVIEFEPVEKDRQLADRHRHQFVDVLPADLDVERFGPQARSSAGMAGGLARIAAEHVFVLDLVALALDPFEERRDAGEVFVAFPEHFLLFGRKLDIRLVDGEVELVGVHHQLFVELLHHLAPPAGNGALIDAQGRVGDDEAFVDADGFAVAPADRTGAERAVVTEQMFGRLFEAHAVGFEQIREVAEACVLVPDTQVAAALGEGGLD